QSLFSSFSHLMFLQLVSRALTFTLNSALLRLASARAYGTAAIQFEFLLSTILFLSREGVRNALLRSKTPHAASTRNVSFIPLLLGLPLSAAAFVLYPRFASEETRRQGYFTTAVAIYVIAALAELLCEPMHNLTMAELRTDIRVRAEGFAMTAKTVTTFLVLFYDARAERDGDLALIAFGAGQLCYSCALLLIYIPHYGVSLLRSTKPDSGSVFAPYFDPALVRLATTMTSQSFMKHILTEGDKVILSVFSPLEDQGGYAVAVNYGSLLARIVFQPIEETLRVYFSKALSASDPAAATHESSNTLETLLSTQISLSAIFVTFAHPYAPLLLNILLPRQYRHTSARTVLSAWVWYIPLLSVNGGLEAFVSSVADGAALNQQSRYMTVISPLYIAAALFFYKTAQFGDRSLVYANMINLVARIAYALHF
ncbi:Rft-1-domain-containing protein, partial [Fistulina hepatica ATCC 64428]